MSTDQKTSSHTDGESSEPDAAEIRDNLERTRASMSETLGALQEQLNPTVLKEKLGEELAAAKEAVKAELAEVKEAVKSELLEAKDALQDEVREQYENAKNVVHDATIGRVEDMARNATHTINEARTSFMDTIRENPIPAAMAGLGLAWLLMNRRTPSNRSEHRAALRGPAERGVRQLAQRAQGEVSDLANQAGQLAHRVQDQAGEYVGQAGQMARQTRRTVQSTFEENPLAIGAVALALGTAVGLALPRTELEDEWLGEARDQLMDKVGEAAHESLGQAKQAVEQLVAGDAEQARAMS